MKRYLIAAALVLACSVDVRQADAQIVCQQIGTFTYCDSVQGNGPPQIPMPAPPPLPYYQPPLTYEAAPQFPRLNGPSLQLPTLRPLR